MTKQLSRMVIPLFNDVTPSDVSNYIKTDFPFIEHTYHNLSQRHQPLLFLLATWYRNKFYTTKTALKWIHFFFGEEFIEPLITKKGLAWFEKQLTVFNQLNC